MPPWKQLTTPRLQIRSDLPPRELRRWAALLEAIVADLNSEGLERDGPVRVRLFRTREQMRAEAAVHGLPDVGGLYDPARREVVLCADGLTVRLAAHELTHALLDGVAPRSPPPWIAEGAAESAAGRLTARWGLPDERPPEDPPDVRGLTYREWSRGDAQTRRARYAAARAWFERHWAGSIGATYRHLTGR